jgi:hypothetical protein
MGRRPGLRYFAPSGLDLMRALVVLRRLVGIDINHRVDETRVRTPALQFELRRGSRFPLQVRIHILPEG